MIGKIRREFLRYIQNFQYEFTKTGVLFPKASVHARGIYEDSINGAPFELAGYNLVVDEGLINFMEVALTGVAAEAGWYVALFNGAATPQSDWTAANFAANATEIIGGYAEANRPAWVPDPTDAVNISIDNDGSPAAYTVVGALTVEGAALLSSNVKGGTAGKLASASRYTASRVLADADAYTVRYGVDYNSP